MIWPLSVCHSPWPPQRVGRSRSMCDASIVHTVEQLITSSPSSDCLQVLRCSDAGTAARLLPTCSAACSLEARIRDRVPLLR